MLKNLREIKQGSLRWIDITKPNKEHAKYLQTEFKFNPLDLEDVLSATQRSKLDKYENYIFMVLLFPVYNRKTQEIEASEVDLFVAENTLITIHRGDLPPLVDLFQICQSSSAAKENCVVNNSQLMLYNILKKLFLYCYPMLDHLNLDITDIEKRIFKGEERKMTKTIMHTRHNIIDMRKILQAHKNTLAKVKKVNKEEKLYSINTIHYDYFDDLIDYAREIWDQLDTFKESIEALQETNESLISFRINDVMKILTIFSVIILPPTLVATIFGMNARYMPYIHDALGFWTMLAVCMLSALLTIIFIWRKKWF